MSRRFVSYGGFQTERQSTFVPGSDSAKDRPMLIKNLIEDTTEEEEDEDYMMPDYDEPLLEYGDEDTGEVYRELPDGTREYRNDDGTYPSDFENDSDEDTGEKGFAAVAGMENLKRQLTDEVLWPLRHKELVKKYRIKPLNGMILYGPPGCGKTYIAKRFAEESGMKYKFVTAGSLGRIYGHGTSARIRELFINARRFAPYIIFIDEIDALLPDRSQVGIEGACADMAESVNEFLSHMNDCGKNGVFVIGSTNNLPAIDSALLRTGRMDKLIYVGLPDEDARKALIEYYLKDRPQEEDIDTAELARLAEGMNASDIEYMFNSVALSAARTESLITFEMLAAQAKSQRRSVCIKDNAKETLRKRPVVGFSQTVQDRIKCKPKLA